MKSVFVRVYPCLLLAGSLMAADPISDALQKGLFEEEANHNFDAAIKAYQSVIDQTAEQRKLAATAVFRLGECYRKLNKTNDAIGQYQRVLREFSDQANLASMSQQNLAALGINASRGADAAAATSAEAEEIEKIKAMIKYSPDLVNAPNPSGQTPLGKAALSGYLAVARFLLDNKAEVDARDNSGYTPLHLAVEGGHKTMVELLLDRGADVNARRNQNQPLHLAASKGYRSIVELLLARKADLNEKGESGRTPLNAATKQGHVAIVKLLLDRGADVNSQDSTGWAPLHNAINSPELTQLILSYKPDLDLENPDGYTPLATVAYFPGGDVRCLELLLQAGADVNAGTKLTPLLAAVRAIRPEKVRVLLEHKADPNRAVKGATPLGYLLNQNFSSADAPKVAEMAELLRKHGAKDEGVKVTPSAAAIARAISPPPVRDLQAEEIERLQRLIKDSPDLINGRDGQGQTALHRAAAAGQTNVILFLLTNKAEINIRDKERWGSTPLHKAVMRGQKQVVELLLANGADVNAWGSEEQDRTEISLASCHALHMAVKQGNQAMVEILINAKADVNGRDYRSRTPLHFAVHQGFLQLVRLLVSKGADLNAADELGRTPAMLAITADYQNIFNFLMEQGLDVNAQDKEGRTLLHQAVYQRPPRILQTILAQHPDLEIGDQQNSTPLINAVDAQNLEAARLLLEAGANPNRRNAIGWFPLFIGAHAGNKEAVELLLKYKTDVNQKHVDNTTALAHVVEISASGPPLQQKAFREIADLLRKHGAKEEAAKAQP